MGIKAIVMDVDGTLTNDKKEITPKTREVLLKAQKQGILLILASGRPTTGLVEMGKVLEMDKNKKQKSTGILTVKGYTVFAKSILVNL